jgi:FkbM family methyltransferase
MRWKGRLARRIRDYAQQHRRGSATFARACERYLAAYNNHDYGMETNGEVRLLQLLRPFNPQVLFDVGANCGEWTSAARRLLSPSSIHAFEIAPSVAAELRAQFQDDPRIVVNDFGLSDTAELIEIDFYLVGTHSGTTMLIEDHVHSRSPKRRENARVERGDAYCQGQGVEAIDFLKVDVEGAEPRTLEGFAGLFERGKIGLVQFEYNSINITSRYLLRDFYRFFEHYGFEVGKLWTHGVSFGPYEFTEENFRGPNYVALHKSRAAMKQALLYSPIRAR